MILRFRHSHLACLLAISALTLCVPPERLAAWQECPPLGVVYVARDVDGSLLPEAEVRQLAKQLPDGVARVMDGQSYVLDDGTIVNENNRGGKSVQGIYLGDPVPCQTRHVGQLTLEHRQKKMRLIFDIDFDPYRLARWVYIDSLPFQDGVFRLTKDPWPTKEFSSIPASRWKKEGK